MENNIKKKHICSNCHSVISVEQLFCTKCGTKLKSLCDRCGAEIEIGQNFCTKCGQGINSGLNSNIQMKFGPSKKSGIIVAVIAVLVITGVLFVYKLYKEEYISFSKCDTNNSKFVNDTEGENTDNEKNTSTDDVKIDNTKGVEYCIYPSHEQYISMSDIVGKTREEIAMMRNEIYARHGYIFNTEPYKTYFSSKSWYRQNQYFSESLFNDKERFNKEFIVQYEKSMGWRE